MNEEIQLKLIVLPDYANTPFTSFDALREFVEQAKEEQFRVVFTYQHIGTGRHFQFPAMVYKPFVEDTAFGWYIPILAQETYDKIKDSYPLGK